MNKTDLLIEKLDLLRMRWRLLNRVTVEPHVLPAALDWINSELDKVEKALIGVGAN